MDHLSTQCFINTCNMWDFVKVVSQEMNSMKKLSILEDKIIEQKRVFFLSAPPTPEALNMSVNMPVVYRTRGKDKAGDLWPETRALLQKYVAPCNSDLATLLGDSRYLWADVYKS